MVSISSWRLSSRPATTFFISSTLSFRGVYCHVSNAALAAFTALSTSSLFPLGTLAMISCVAGFSISIHSSCDESTHSPLMYSLRISILLLPLFLKFYACSITYRSVSNFIASERYAFSSSFNSIRGLLTYPPFNPFLPRPYFNACTGFGNDSSTFSAGRISL